MVFIVYPVPKLQALSKCHNDCCWFFCFFFNQLHYFTIPLQEADLERIKILQKLGLTSAGRLVELDACKLR